MAAARWLELGAVRVARQLREPMVLLLGAALVSGARGVVVALLLGHSL